tara:strand:- start:2139 stop:2624 length:486 start_codon:yes stop_codon:yes gene_type:complete
MANIKLTELLSENIVFQNKGKLTEAQLLEIQQILNEGPIGNFTMGVALAVAALFGGSYGVDSYKTDKVENALANGDQVEVTLGKNLSIFEPHSNHNRTYIIKVDTSQNQEIKVDTSKNVVTLKSPKINSRHDVVKKVNKAVRDIDPSLASNWTKFANIKVK